MTSSGILPMKIHDIINVDAIITTQQLKRQEKLHRTTIFIEIQHNSKGIQHDRFVTMSASSDNDCPLRGTTAFSMYHRTKTDTGVLEGIIHSRQHCDDTASASTVFDYYRKETSRESVRIRERQEIQEKQQQWPSHDTFLFATLRQPQQPNLQQYEQQ